MAPTAVFDRDLVNKLDRECHERHNAGLISACVPHILALNSVENEDEQVSQHLSMRCVVFGDPSPDVAWEWNGLRLLSNWTLSSSRLSPERSHPHNYIVIRERNLTEHVKESDLTIYHPHENASGT